MLAQKQSPPPLNRRQKQQRRNNSNAVGESISSGNPSLVSRGKTPVSNNAAPSSCQRTVVQVAASTPPSTKWYKNHHRLRRQITVGTLVGLMAGTGGSFLWCQQHPSFALPATVVHLRNTPQSTTSSSSSTITAANLQKQQQEQQTAPDRVWKAHYPPAVSSDEETTAKLSTAAVRNFNLHKNDEYDEHNYYSGVYQFVNDDIPACNKNSKCLIYFPEEKANANENSVCHPSACLVTKTGAKGHYVPNQDRSVILASSSTEDWFLAALFDGHGERGHVASQVAVTDLPLLILKQRAANKNLVSENILHTAFLETDQGRIAHVVEAGTAAVVVWREGSTVHLASAGDSTAVLVQWLGDDDDDGKKLPWLQQQKQQFRNWLPWHRSGSAEKDGESSSYKILASAVKHKPGDPMERARIEANGGFVRIPFNPTESSRVVYEMKRASGISVQTALAMSRALGDSDAKKNNLVIADADVVSVDLRDYYTDDESNSSRSNTNRFFVILASDGVMDMMPWPDVILPLGKALFPEASDTVDGTVDNTLYRTCQSIMNKAASGWSRRTFNSYRDDMSLAVKKIEFR